MPDACWYEQMYGSRDATLMDLEPGHEFFLRDTHAPGRGRLLDIGCGTGNFLAAARDTGYEVTGTELDRHAANFAKEKFGLARVFGLTITDFVKKYSADKFDVITFFEVLEHQADPLEFLESVKACLCSRGYIALSVPNRGRWQTGPDMLDYPPNHFLRWSELALNKFLSAGGFEVVSLREQSAGLRYAAQMINTKLRTGLSKRIGGPLPQSFRDVMQMDFEEAEAALQAKPPARQIAMRWLGRAKSWACLPIALGIYPYLRIKRLKGPYLYLLARQRH